MIDFSGKAVLVSGASRGIGRATAQQFAANGARVAVHYHRNRPAAEETLSSLDGDGHIVVQGDVADATQVWALVEEITQVFGAIDVLVNNAGIYEEHPLAEVDYAQWRVSWQRVLGTNLLGAANLTFCVAQQMIAQGGGHIVNVSSRGAFRGEPEAPAYGASKAGLNAMGQSLAKYLAPFNIFVTMVAPGWVETDMAEDWLHGESGRAIREQSPLQRVARPEEVAYAILFLASEEATFLTGTIVDVNGASYLRM
jgi:NAD(P)-dependent dehydrogenase (short-subunit alcohol dehydrogenase family)